MEPLGKFLNARPAPAAKKHRSERGDLFDLILGRINPERVKDGYPPYRHGHLGFKLTRIPTKDLYALISKCDDAERRGKKWGAVFESEIKPKKQDVC